MPMRTSIVSALRAGRVRQIRDRRRERVHLCLIAGCGRCGVQVRRKLGERRVPLRARLASPRPPASSARLRSCRRRARSIARADRDTRAPARSSAARRSCCWSCVFQYGQLHRLRGGDLVLGDQAARHQLVDVQAARDLRADDDAVVPVGGPRAAARSCASPSTGPRSKNAISFG